MAYRHKTSTGCSISFTQPPTHVDMLVGVVLQLISDFLLSPRLRAEIFHVAPMSPLGCGLRHFSFVGAQRQRRLVNVHAAPAQGSRINSSL